MISQVSASPSSSRTTIQRLVFSGGGAKGIAYPGAYRALVDSGVFNDVNEVAGSSAGSIAAAMMAVGMLKDMYQQKLLGVNFETLLGDRVGSVFGTNQEGNVFFTKDGNPLENEIRQGIIASIQVFIHEVKDTPLSIDVAAIFDKFKQTPPQPFTFRDLFVLTQHYPNRFKRLTVTAVKLSNGKLKIFNCLQTPDVEIALACRASCSIPMVLEPVSISIGEQVEKYVDGGLYDNIPTNYFDVDAQNQFVENLRKDQTLLFSFMTGFEPSNSAIYNALYGDCWDECVDEKLLKNIIQETIDATHSVFVGKPNRPENEKLEILKANLEKKLNDWILVSSEDEKKNATFVANKILLVMVDVNKKLLLHANLFQWIGEEPLIDVKKELLNDFMISALMPQVCKIGKAEKFLHDYVLKMGNSKTNYDTIEQKKKGYQKIRRQYPLRTIELRVGPISTLGFAEANKYGRMIDSFSYLNTMDHITNHDLHDSNMFFPGVLYTEIVNNFEKIYSALLLGLSLSLKDDELLKEMASLKADLKGRKDASIHRQLYQLIKHSMDSETFKHKAFALSRAVEFHFNRMGSEKLFEEIYIECHAQSSLLAISHVSEEKCYTTSAVKRAIEKRHGMFALLSHQRHKLLNSQMKIIFNMLNKLDKFNDGYHQHCVQQTAASTFNLLLIQFKKKVEQLEGKAYQNGNVIDEQYVKAYSTANALYQSLSSEAKQCFIDNTISIKTFKNRGMSYIDIALPELKNHRSRFLVNLLRHVIYFFRNLNPFKSHFFDASKTDSAYKVELLAKGLNGMAG